MLVIAADPGLTGALCLLGEDVLELYDLPVCGNGQESGSMRNWLDVQVLREQLLEWSGRHEFARVPVHAVLERPVAMPKLPAQTVAAQFDTVGVLRTLLWLTADKLDLVNPREWQKPFGLGGDKAGSRKVASTLYPAAAERLARVKDHNRAESLLIAHFHRRRLLG